MKRFLSEEFHLIALTILFFLLSAGIVGIKTRIDKLANQMEMLEINHSIIYNDLHKLSVRTATVESVQNIESKKDYVNNLIIDKVITPIRKDISATLKLVIAESIQDFSKKYDLPIELLTALIRVESAFNPAAVSNAGAQGLTQVMPYTAEDIKKTLRNNVYKWNNPRQNIEYGAYYLSKMVDIFNGDYTLAIMAYNGGPHAVSKWNAYNKCRKAKQKDCGPNTTLREETTEYKTKVLNFMKHYQQMGIN